MLGIVIPLAGLIAYSTSFSGVFVFDDRPYIAAMSNIRTLGAPWTYLGPSRGLMDYSLAVNYAIGGMEPFGYHVFNVAVHLLVGLALCAVVRRTLAMPRWSAELRAHANLLAIVIAAVWIVHPLTTEAVTYIVHRSESMMALFYLLTLYGAIRYFESRAKPMRWLWLIATACALWLGVNSKQVIASAPLVVLLYDRTFVSPTGWAAIKRHWALYAALFASWLSFLKAVDYGQAVLVGGGGAGIEASKISMSDYLLSQSEVLLHYLRLCIVPYPQSIDYGWTPVDSVAQAAPAGIMILALLGTTGWLLWRRHAAGFLGAVFFLVLAPTSSFMPLDDLVAERRMYLPLAAVVALVVGVVWRRVSRRVFVAGCAGVVAALAITTIARNRTYHSEITIWESALRVNPDNARGHSNIGPALIAAGQRDEAIKHYRRALAIKPRHASARNNLGAALIEARRFEEAAKELSLAIADHPTYFAARSNLAKLFRKKGEWAKAAEHAKQALELSPNDTDTLVTLAVALGKLGRSEAAFAEYRKALELQPDNAEAHGYFGKELANAHRVEEGLVHLERAAALAPDDGPTHAMYGWVLMEAGRKAEAVAELVRATTLDPSDPIARATLNRILKRP